MRYAGRLDDGQNGWNGDCNNPEAGDACWGVDDPSVQVTYEPGHAYTWWVHAINSCGVWSDVADNYPVDIVDPSRGPATIDVDTNFDGTVQPGVRTVRWDSVEIVAGYALRIDDATANGWNGACNGGQNPGDVCEDVGGGTTTYNYNFQAGHSYTIWVHSLVCGSISNPASVSVSVPPPPPPDSAPYGTFDSASCTQLNGWACDADNYSQALQVDFFSDGGNFLGSTQANVVREPAVGAACGGGTSAHGFNGYLLDPTNPRHAPLFDGAPHTIVAYAIGIDSAGTQNSNNPAINDPAPQESVTCTLPTPTPAPWIKLRDTSFQGKGTVTSEIPDPVDAFESSSDTTSPFFVGRDPAAPAAVREGVVAAPGLQLDADNSNANEKASTSDWRAVPYTPSTSFNKARYLLYVKSRKQHKTVSSLAGVTGNGIWNVTSPSTINAAFVAGLPAGARAVIIVNGAATITDSIPDTGRSIAILANSITVAPSVGEINAILVADSLNTGAADLGLKIVGNLIVTSAGSLTNGRTQNAAANNKPSLFVVHNTRTFMNLLPYLSTNKFEWKQLQ